MNWSIRTTFRQGSYYVSVSDVNLLHESGPYMSHDMAIKAGSLWLSCYLRNQFSDEESVWEMT